MNGAPGTYRRYSKELLQQSACTTDSISGAINRSESDSGYQSSSSAEPRKQPVTNQNAKNAKRILSIQHFAPAATEIKINASQTGLQLPVSQTDRLDLRCGFQRLSRLELENGFSEIHPKLQLRISDAETLDDTSEDKPNHPLSSVSKLSGRQRESSDLAISSESRHNISCASYSSATSSPSSHANTESPMVSVDDAKSDNHLGSPSEASVAGSAELPTEVESLPNFADRPKPKNKNVYRRFDSRQLMNTISLPSVHPSAQNRAVLDPLAPHISSWERRSRLPDDKMMRDVPSRGRSATITTRSQNVESDSADTLMPNQGSASTTIESPEDEIFPRRNQEPESKTNEPSQKDNLPSPTLGHVQSPRLQPANPLLVGSRLLSRPDSLGGFNYVESRQNTRRAKRNAGEKKRQERELLISDFNLKLSAQEGMGTFDALFKLSFNGAHYWIKSNLLAAVQSVSTPLRFTMKLMEFWFMRSGQRHSPSHERALIWLLNPLSSILLQLCQQQYANLSHEDDIYIRQKLMTLGSGLPPQIWANLIHLLELPIAEEELLAKTRELLSNVGRLDEVFFFVKELSLQSSLPFEDLFVPLIRTKHYKWAAELAQGNSVLLHQLVMAVFLQDAKQALRIILDCSMDVYEYRHIETAAKLPELQTIMHQGLLIEFAELICGDNFDLQLDISASALKSGHRSDFDALCRLFGITADDLDLEMDFVISEQCDICLQNKMEFVRIDLHFLQLPVEYIFDPSDSDLEYFLLSSSLIGIEMECNPAFSRFCQADDKVSILQLATPNCCIVLDLMFPLGQHRMEILRSAFENPDILKLGFGIESDLQMLSRALMDPSFTKMHSVLDLQQVAAKIIPSQSRKQFLSLTQFCEAILGLQLDKTEQLSNWERRPLRESQALRI